MISWANTNHNFDKGDDTGPDVCIMASFLDFSSSDSAMVPIPLAKPWTTYGQGFNDPSYVKYGDHLNE